MLKKAATAVGAVFLVIGIGGFLPFLVSDDKLLGLFLVDTTHNIVHILSGLAFLAAAQKERLSRLAFQIFGLVYALVTIIGFMVGDGGSVLGLFNVNTVDNFLHLALTAAFLYLGFATPERRDDATATPVV